LHISLQNYSPSKELNSTTQIHQRDIKILKMASTTPAPESITSDVVIVESPTPQNSTATEPQAPELEKPSESDEALEEPELANTTLAFRPNLPRGRVIRRNYSPPPPIRSRSQDAPVLTNTSGLDALLASPEPDICIETVNGNIIYITSHSIPSQDLEKLTWLFHLGTPDAWAQKPTSFLPQHGFQFDHPNGNGNGRGRVYDCYDDGYNNRNQIARADLGSALKEFKDDAEASKVKFVIAVEGKGHKGWMKLIVAWTRQTAMVSIFHEIINNQEIAFVGAVLKDVTIPVESENRGSGMKLQKVGSVKEAEEVGKGFVGVIC
jgi:hypothetical protein